jgi:parallel beta-helix repeat protein
VQNVLSENQAAGMYITDEYGLNVDAGSNQVRGNALFANLYGIVLGGFGDGNQIEHNSLWGNGIGIELSDSFGDSEIGQNRLSRNGTGITLLESRNARVRENRVSLSGTGPLIFTGDGIYVEEQTNIVEKNISRSKPRRWHRRRGRGRETHSAQEHRQPKR